MSALRLARAVQALDLTNELEQIRTHGIRCSVIGCSTDELITPAHCRRLAELLGAGYREVCATGGHIWMITHPELLMAALATRQAVAELSPPNE
jgi:homoserine acetyltransferase